MPSITEIIKSLEDAIKDFNKQTGANNVIIEPTVEPVANTELVPVDVPVANTDPVPVDVPVANTDPVPVDVPSNDVVVEVPDIVIPKEVVDIDDTIKDFIKQVNIVIEKIKPLANSDGVYWGDGANPFNK